MRDYHQWLSAVCLLALMCTGCDSFFSMATILCSRNNTKIKRDSEKWKKIIADTFCLSIIFRFLVVRRMFVAFFFPLQHLHSLFPCGPSRGQKNRNLPQSSCGAWPCPSPAHHSPSRPGFSVGRIAVSMVRQPGALGRWQGVRASGRGPLKSHVWGATPTRPLRWKLF